MVYLEGGPRNKSEKPEEEKAKTRLCYQASHAGINWALIPGACRGLFQWSREH